MNNFLLRLTSLVAMVIAVIVYFEWQQYGPWPAISFFAGSFYCWLKLELLDLKPPDEIDKQLFQSALSILTFDKVVLSIAHNNSWDKELFANLIEFMTHWNSAEKEFRDKIIDKKRAALRSAVKDFIECFVHEKSIGEDNDKFYILPNLEKDQPLEYSYLIKKIDRAGVNLVRAQQDFIRAGRRRLRL